MSDRPPKAHNVVSIADPRSKNAGLFAKHVSCFAPTRDHTTRNAALDARGNQPSRFPQRPSSRNARQHRPAHPAHVRDGRLLGLPARAGPRHARAGRDRRAAPRQRRTRPDAIVGRAGRARRRTVAAAGRGRCDDASAVQVFQRGGRRPVPLVPRRAAHRSGPASGRAGRPDPGGARRSARTPSGCSRPPAPSSRRSSAQARTHRTVRGARASPARGAGPATCGGAGTTTRSACSARSIRCCGASSTTTRSRCSSTFPIARLEERASALLLHSRINYAYRRMQEHLTSTRTWGAQTRGRALGTAGRVFLGRVRPARVGADLFRRPRHSRGRSHQSGFGPRHPAGRRRASTTARVTSRSAST